jgi:hypothetical protein
VLKLLGILALVALILLGALMPLKYTARMRLPAASRPAKPAGDTSESPSDDSAHHD